MKTEIQKTELYQQFKKALGINDIRTDDNPYIVECCKIAEDYAKLRLSAVMPSLPSQNEIDAQIDKYAFRVPYDGSNNFYDEVALKHYKAGIEWLLGRIRGNGT